MLTISMVVSMRWARRGDVIALDSGPAMMFADALADELQRLSPQATKEDQSAAAARLWELAWNLHLDNRPLPQRRSRVAPWSVEQVGAERRDVQAGAELGG